jgi:hypothetical protein
VTRDLDEALADLASQALDGGALLPASDRWREAVMAAVRADRQRRPSLAAGAALRHPARPLDMIREARDWQKAEPHLRRVAARHGYGVDVMFGKRKYPGEVAARDDAKAELLAIGMSAHAAARVFDCRHNEVTRGAARHAAREVFRLAVGRLRRG